MILALEFAGAVAILVPFVLLQAGRLAPHTACYLWLNLVGSGVLTGVAWIERQWGFVLVQAVWTLVAGWGLARLAGGGRASRPRP